jgi:hypothetical protein
VLVSTSQTALRSIAWWHETAGQPGPALSVYSEDMVALIGFSAPGFT